MNKYIYRILTIVMAIVMAFGLTACSGETTPETTAAPTTEPVNVCETKGHTWIDATCEAPRTCSVCSETEGEALGHTWVDASYQAPKTCSVCAATEGEKLISYFEEYGLDARLLEKSGEYELEQPCATDDSKTTVARIIIEDYKTIVSDESHEAIDGYEWKILTIKQRFCDENAQKYGGNLGTYLWSGKYESGTTEADADYTGLFEDGMRYPMKWNGVEYPDGLLHIQENVSDWMEDDEGTRYIDIIVTVSIRVPAGYDGFVFGLENAKWEWPEGAYLHEVITDNTLIFCFD